MRKTLVTEACVCYFERVKHKCLSSKRGLTLVELLGVVSILAILVAILFPVVGKGVESARRAAVASNLRQIALVYLSISDAQSLHRLNQAKTANEWAALLAEEGGLVEAALYIDDQDPLLQRKKHGAPGKVIGVRTEGGFQVDEGFLRTPLCVTILKNIPANAPKASTPLAYTRGLDPVSGRWHGEGGDDCGGLGADGGFIVYLDGHVGYYRDVCDQLTRYGSLEATSKIAEAVPPGVEAINWRGVVWEARR